MRKPNNRMGKTRFHMEKSKMGNAPALAAFAAPTDCRCLKHPWGDVWKAGEPSEHLETLTLGEDLGDNRLLTCTGYYHVRLRSR